MAGNVARSFTSPNFTVVYRLLQKSYTSWRSDTRPEFDPGGRLTDGSPQSSRDARAAAPSSLERRVAFQGSVSYCNAERVSTGCPVVARAEKASAAACAA